MDVRLAKKEGGEINSGSFVNIAWEDEILEINDGKEGLVSSAKKEHDPSAKIDLGKMNTMYKK